MLQQNKNLLACLVLLWSAASSYAAEPQRWCSYDGYDHPAELVILDDGPVIKINGEVKEHPDKEYISFGTMDYLTGSGVMYRDQKVAIYHDHLFWPCP